MPDQRISSSAYDLPAYVYATFTDEGAMLLDTRGKGTWFAINAAGAHYLSVLVSGGSAPAGISALVKRYQIDQGMASADMTMLVTRMVHRGLLQIAEARRE